MLQLAVALVPKKLYTMKVDTQVDGVKMINGHLALFGPYYIGIIDNVKLKYMAPKAGFLFLIHFRPFFTISDPILFQFWSILRKQYLIFLKTIKSEWNHVNY